MITELKEIKCPYCKKYGYDERESVEEGLTATENGVVVSCVIWVVRCKYCKKMKRIVWSR